jgi:hypothetical protein
MTGIIESARVLLPVAFTLLAPLFIWLNRGNQNRREAMSFIAGALTFASVLSLAPQVLAGNIWKYTLFEIMPGITVTFNDRRTGPSIFGLVASFFCGCSAHSNNIGTSSTGLARPRRATTSLLAVALTSRGGVPCRPTFHALSSTRIITVFHVSA